MNTIFINNLKPRSCFVKEKIIFFLLGNNFPYYSVSNKEILVEVRDEKNIYALPSIAAIFPRLVQSLFGTKTKIS